jgi:kumamolisin
MDDLFTESGTPAPQRISRRTMLAASAGALGAAMLGWPRAAQALVADCPGPSPTCSGQEPIDFVRLHPAEVATLYDFPETGADGETVGIIGWGAPGEIGVDLLALCQYFQGMKLPVPEINIVIVPGSHQRNGAVSGELMLDTEVVGTFAPSAVINIYLTQPTAPLIAAAIQQAVKDGCSVTTCSFGNPFDCWTKSDRKTIDGALRQATQDYRVTACFASGDSGALRIAYPAASPYALAVGGTFMPSRGVTEVWWNWPNLSRPVPYGWQASGGGVVPTEVPQYQHKIKPMSFPVGGKTFKGRGVPDVAGLAEGNAFWEGTSACSPLWAALIAVINAALGKRVGDIHDAIYRDPYHSGAFNSVTIGNNIPPQCAVIGTPQGYQAQPEWDACTGLGTPNGMNLLNLLMKAK